MAGIDDSCCLDFASCRRSKSVASNDCFARQLVRKPDMTTRLGTQDLFFSFISLYNTLMKIFFITATAVIVFWMVTKFKSSYDIENDKFHGDGSFMVRSLALVLTFAVMGRAAIV